MRGTLPKPVIHIDLLVGITSWVQPDVLDIRTFRGCGREPFTAVLQRECQADHHDAVANQEVRIGQRT